ncbi:hypothetical protein BKA70DRAFT_1344825 [Coprinopsis sp. MPI-PUGE-AT-0042]|nr:hypothetical protein BKA70DRAFT_1344825 [Coprinopsis sp. MPI-PUGE-AT-0042]
MRLQLIKYVSVVSKSLGSLPLCLWSMCLSAWSSGLFVHWTTSMSPWSSPKTPSPSHGQRKYQHCSIWTLNFSATG